MAAGIWKLSFAELARETTPFFWAQPEETKNPKPAVSCPLSAQTEALFESFFVSIYPL